MRYQATVVMIVLIIGLAFYAGFLEGNKGSGQAVSLSCNQNILSKLSIPLEALAAASGPTASQGRTGTGYVGSKNGTKYYPSVSCAGAKRIKSTNYIWFSSAEDAQLQGYTPGKC